MKNVKKLLIIFLVVSFVLVGNVYATEFNDNISATLVDNEVATIDNGTCEGGIATICDIPAGLATMIHDIYDLLKIAVPIVLIIMGMIDLLKAVAGQKEEDIKKGWNMLIKRTLYGVLVFFVFTTVQLVISLLPGDNQKVISCVKYFFTGEGNNVSGCINTGANTDNKN